MGKKTGGRAREKHAQEHIITTVDDWRAQILGDGMPTDGYTTPAGCTFTVATCLEIREKEIKIKKKIKNK